VASEVRQAVRTGHQILSPRIDPFKEQNRNSRCGSGIQKKRLGDGWRPKTLPRELRALDGPGLNDVSCEGSAIIRPGEVDTPIARGHTRYGTDEMDFDPVCVDDRRTVVHRAGDGGGEGSRRARQLGDRGCDRTRLLERMGGVHTACDWSSQTVAVDGAEVRTSYSDPRNHVVPDGSPGICHRILSERWTSAVTFSHNRSWCAAPSPDVHRQCSVYELYWHPYVLASCGTVSVGPLLPGRDGAPDSSGATGNAALPRRT